MPLGLITALNQMEFPAAMPVPLKLEIMELTLGADDVLTDSVLFGLATSPTCCNAVAVAGSNPGNRGLRSAIVVASGFPCAREQSWQATLLEYRPSTRLSPYCELFAPRQTSPEEPRHSLERRLPPAE